MIQNKSQVSIEYTVKDGSGEVVDTNVGSDPLTYVQGEKQILPALEEALEGLSVGDSKRVGLEPEQAYGAVDQSLFEAVPISSVPEEARQVGTRLLAKVPSGQTIPIRVHEIRDSEVVVDMNHPMAGQSLHFEVTILAVE